MTAISTQESLLNDPSHLPSAATRHLQVHADTKQEGGGTTAISKEADVCLMATGRKPNTKNLGLEDVRHCCCELDVYKINCHHHCTTVALALLQSWCSSKERLTQRSSAGHRSPLVRHSKAVTNTSGLQMHASVPSRSVK